MASSNEINKIRKKIASTGWPKKIINVTIDGLHGFKEQQIDFKFPVCAIVGENGTGKSTILKAVASLYKSPSGKILYPSDFFPETKWDKAEKISLIYQLNQGSSRVLTKKIVKTNRWRGITQRPGNHFYYFDVNRVRSIESVVGFSKLANKKIRETASRALQSETISNLSEIMGRKYLKGRYAKTSADKTKEVSVLKLKIGEISQFHQGTGESIVFDKIAAIENIPNNSLVVIDEIESSLHPKAQRGLIRNLLRLARTKSLQIIFSTHSPYILSELPSEARILLSRVSGGINVTYAPSVEFCLSHLDDELHTELDILVEDLESVCLMSEILRINSPEILKRVRILPVGAANIIKTFEGLYLEKKFPSKIMGFVDADQDNNEPANKLPGEFSVERQVVGDIIKFNLYPKLSDFLGDTPENIKKEFEDVQTISDHHKWIEKLAKKFVISERVLLNQLSSLWVKNCLEKDLANNTIEKIKNRLSEELRVPDMWQ